VRWAMGLGPKKLEKYSAIWVEGSSNLTHQKSKSRDKEPLENDV
jgi:hypothetical protein